MKANFLSVVFVALTSALIVRPSAKAGTVSTSAGDLFLGVRAVSGAGATQDYIVNIGQASAYRDAISPFAVPNLGDLGADLIAVFGANWSTRADVLWSIAGTPGGSAVGADPARTIYATVRETGPALTRAAAAAQAAPVNKLTSLSVAYLQTAGTPNASTANSPVGIVQSTTDVNSYASFHNVTSSYSYFSPPIEGDFGNGVAASVLSLYRLVPATDAAVGTPGEFLGRFLLDSNGGLTYAPASFSTVRLEGSTFSIGEADGQLVLKVVRGGNLTAAVDVNITATDGTAHAGSDFSGDTNTTVSFAANQTEATVAFTIVDRAGYQGDRAFTVALSNPSVGAAVVPHGGATITIAEDDPLPAGEIAFSAGTYEFASLNGSGNPNTVVVTLSRTSGTAGVVSVGVSASGGSLSNGTDYSAFTNPTTVDFADGATSRMVSIQLRTISASSLPGTIELALGNPTGGASLGSQTSATITITAPPTPSDTTLPTVTLSAPRANAKFTGANVVFSGIAKDNVGVARVEIALNGNAPQAVTPASATNDFNWSLTLVPEQGNNTATITAFDPAGNASAAVNVSFSFTNLRPLLAGSYNGLVVDASTTALFDRSGLVSVKVSPTGSFSGKLTISGTVLPISGVFLTSGDARFGNALTPTFELRKSGTLLGFLALTLDTGAGLKITGTIKAAGNTTLATIPRADLAVYTPKPNPAAPFKNVPTVLLDPTKERGKYTAIFGPSAVVVATPQGISYGTVTISSKGVAKFVGKAADGAAISASNALSRDNHWPFFAQLYAKQGFIVGDVAFDPTQTESDATGALTWFKPAGLANQKLYPNGWPTGLLVDFAASKYLKPASSVNSGTVLGVSVPGATNIEIALTGGGLTADTRNDARLDAKSKVTVLGATAGFAGADALKATFATGNGGLNGSFAHPGNGKVVKFFGTVFQKTNSAAGYFLYVPAIGSAESGALSVSKK